jgi:glucosyl-3-phosphoglycerate phosphatase
LWAFYFVRRITKVTSSIIAAIEHLNRTRHQFSACVPTGLLLPAVQSFYFLRHGQTERNAMRVFQGADEPLNSTGFDQARQAAAILGAHRITRIVCSDLLRAMQTASTLSSTLDAKPEPSSSLRERHFGVSIGTSSADIDWEATPPAGESLMDFVTRSCLGVKAALESKEPTLLVAHGGTLHALIAVLQLQPDLSIYANARPLQFVRDGCSWRVNPLNPEAHHTVSHLNVS